MNLYKGIAQFYDLEDDNYGTIDISFYKKYAHIINDTILELGCGTGRVSIELAKIGFKVTGIDLSDDMLSIFKKKIKKNNELKNYIKLSKQNIANFTLNEKFGLIIAPGRVFQSLTSTQDIHNSLQCIKKHLKKNGLFILDLFNPETFLDEDYCYEPIVVFDKKVGSDRICMEYCCNKIDKQKKLVYSTYSYTVKHNNRCINQFKEKNCLKYYSLKNIIQLLEKNDFKIIKTFGWFDESSIDTKREIIILLKK